MTITDPRRNRAARVLTEVGAPVVVLVAMPLVIALHSANSTAAGLGMGLLAALFFGIIPFGYVLRGVRLGHWKDHHIGAREQRKPVFLFSLGSMLAGTLILVLTGAPRDLIAFLVTLLAEAALALAVTLVWKISLHTWVSTIGATALVVVYGWGALVLWPILAGIGWSRVELRDHTFAQVAAGALLGIASTSVIFPGLR